MTREEQIIEAGKIAAEGKEFSVLVNRQRRTMSAYEIGFIEGAEWADQHPQWIPVEERLPDKEKDNPSLSVNVIVTDGHSWFESYYNFNLHLWVGANLYGTITHWMEIVPPRKEE